MDWIGEKEAKAAAKKGVKAALECSIEHWRQIYRRKTSWKQVCKFPELISAESCGLCSYDSIQPSCACSNCLATTINSCCNGLTGLVHDALNDNNPIAFTKAAKKVYKFLKGLEK